MTHPASNLPSDTYSTTRPPAVTEFTDSDGVVFSSEFESVFDRRTIIIKSKGRAEDAIEFYASDAERIIDLIRGAAA
jgi:hypothetical protein